MNWKIWIDTGGTFTDCMAITPNGDLKRLKVLSSSLVRVKILEQINSSTFKIALPDQLQNNFLIGFTISINKQQAKIKSINASTVVISKSFPETKTSTCEITSHEEVPVFAARLLTQTKLSDPFPSIDLKLGSTRGTNALLERKGARTAFLVTKGFKDLLSIGNQQRPDLFALNVIKESPLQHLVIEIEERIESDGDIHQPINVSQLRSIVTVLKKNKISSVAIALINSYKNPVHEELIESYLREEGFKYISASYTLSKQIKILPRAETSVVNAYLDPIIRDYVTKIQQGLRTDDFFVMSSAGGLLSANHFLPKDSLLSGPAGGVMGGLSKAKQSGVHKIVTFDMGGTSTDVSLCNDRPDYRYECAVGNLKILSPSLAIETIAAGGGSICSFDGFKFSVGPESAGASPGPACYGAGGPLTITDVNLLLGKLDEDNFSIPIHVEKSQQRLDELVTQLKKTTRKPIEPLTLLESFVEIANEKMAEAIRKVSIQQGHDVNEYALLGFGGAGGQHACSLAKSLRIDKIIVPYDAGLLSAYGIGHASVERIIEEQLLTPLPTVLNKLTDIQQSLFIQAKHELASEGFNTGQVKLSKTFLFLRLSGQESSIEIEYEAGDQVEQKFMTQYKKIYGHWVSGRVIEVELVRVVVTVQEEVEKISYRKVKKYPPKPYKSKQVFLSGVWKKCNVYRWEEIMPGASLQGPALIISDTSTLFLEDDWLFTLEANQNAIVTREKNSRAIQTHQEEAKLELYTNRFTSIAQDMGALLQRTSFSVNVKERLDFSCALLDANGNLIVNAPHIPVHLGSLGVCVREVKKVIDLRDGDVVITNHPAYGGSHLPDITLIKPIYFKRQLVGYVANRAHHAEIGGTKPGSMPANATSLEEEGVVIRPMYLVKNNKARWDEIEKILLEGPYPSRSVQENMADLNGALAALHYGEQGIQQLCHQFGTDEVQHYMGSLYQYAEKMLQQKIVTLQKDKYIALERLDDGSVLKAKVLRLKNKLVIDFTGSSPTHGGNMNATQAIVNSVVLYVLRLLVNEPLPLNEGLLENVKLIIPTGILNPKFATDHKKSPAVVGGNTEVSQRLTDTLLKAFGLIACSQGTMNNFLFGNTRFGYYETICGGTGAGKGFNGTNAVHHHMTNTRITDPEIMEHRYPVRVEQFSIRKGSGGKGKWNGGEGIIREILFKEELEINILTQHRVTEPYGMKGGHSGTVGEQYIIRANGKKEKLKGISGATVNAGDRVVIKTPGGGGWGKG